LSCALTALGSGLSLSGKRTVSRILFAVCCVENSPSYFWRHPVSLRRIAKVTKVNGFSALSVQSYSLHRPRLFGAEKVMGSSDSIIHGSRIQHYHSRL
jgi:hypothetical protein